MSSYLLYSKLFGQTDLTKYILSIWFFSYVLIKVSKRFISFFNFLAFSASVFVAGAASVFSTGVALFFANAAAGSAGATGVAGSAGATGVAGAGATGVAGAGAAGPTGWGKVCNLTPCFSLHAIRAFTQGGRGSSPKSLRFLTV
jgi:hypothetical protein